MRKFLSCILVVAIIAAMAMSVSASNSDCCEAGLIGTPSAEELAFSAQKGNAVMRIMEIREKYIENGGQISDEERNEIERLIAIYYPKASIFDYLPMMGTRSNIGDHQVKYLDLPGKEQEYDSWCGPASGYAVLKGQGINVTQSDLATAMHTDNDGVGGTMLWRVPNALNQYSDHTYAVQLGYKIEPNNTMTAQEWAVYFTNLAIATLLADYGVIYDVNQVEGSLNYLQTYGTPTGGAYSDMKHYVAGEGFDSSTPSRRICYYYDSNTLDRLGTHHMQVTFQVMAVLCNDMGVVY